MNTKVTAFFTSLTIHAAFLGAYFISFSPQNLPVKSQTKPATSISLSMFEVSNSQPVVVPPAQLEPESVHQPKLPEPVKKKAPEKTLKPPKKKPEPTEKKVTQPKHEASKQAKVIKADEKRAKPIPAVAPLQQTATAVLAKRIDGLSDADVEGLEDQYKSAVRSAILNNRLYPRQARRKRQQGTVVIAFRLQSNGVIEDLRVVKSSGVTKLDKAALEAVDKVKRFSPFPKDVSRRHWDFEIPVSFKLS